MSEFDNIKIESIDTSNDAQIDAVNEQQIQIRFRPVPSAARYLPVAPTNTFSVPTRLSRLGLSELLNHVLDLKPPRQFEFLINNKFLRVPLATYLETHSLSTEEELNIEYLEATPPPNRDQNIPHPDWVSSVDASLGVLPTLLQNASEKEKSLYYKKDGILSVVGCYDHIVRVWAHSIDVDDEKSSNKFAKSSHSLVAQGAGHYGPVTSVRVARPFVRSMSAAPALMVSGSHDKTARLWSLTAPEIQTETSPNPLKASRLQCLGVFDYHVGTVTGVETLYHPNRPHSLMTNSVDHRVDKVRFITVGYDGVAAVWNNSKEYLLDEDTVAEKYSLMSKGMGRKLKAQRTAMEQSASKTTNTDDANELNTPHYRPMKAYLGHRGPISCAIWPNEQHFYTAGYDTTIRLWDMERSNYLHAWSGGHVVNCLDFNGTLNLIASGDQDGMVRLWDPRVPASVLNGEDADDEENNAAHTAHLPTTRTNRGQFRACANWISSVKWLPSVVNSPYYLCTTGYDGKSKLWDIRSNKPLHEMDTNSERLLCGDFVPTVSPQSDQHQTGVFQICGGTGKQLDRLHWNINIQG